MAPALMRGLKFSNINVTFCMNYNLYNHVI